MTSYLLSGIPSSQFPDCKRDLRHLVEVEALVRKQGRPRIGIPYYHQSVAEPEWEIE